ncbi:PPOX class F420-dependent oxidoreductase [Nocardia sp. BMG51109]|uniref:PPOX class F420-dependent oxidoreductase n=1 Tax=Nocardia sp. BMG51109 TaxID=1056816 RepID=UPI0004648D77|nr:PPOX class F420-dependent oxidoreductase [Nocardia sp. BMG51109]
MDNPFGPAGTADYVLLTTFRKDGTPVGTPLWAVLDDGRLYVWTVADSWKVKRIRRNPAVTLQPCSATGTPHGAAIEGSASILDDEGSERVRRLIKRKYPVQGRLVVTGSVLRRGRRGTVGIEITAGS